MRKKSMSKAVTPHSLFGPPPILEGEDAATYDELFGRVCAAVKPVDVIDEMLMADVVCLEWEVLRWRRLKTSLIRSRGLAALRGFLCEQLAYNQYRKCFEDKLTEILQDNLPEDQAEGTAWTLAHACARNETDAIDKVNEVLAAIGRDMKYVLGCAQAHKADELVQKYVQLKPGAVKLIHQLLAGAGVSIDSLMVEALGERLEYIERIDRLTTIAENRRDASLREIDRRRAVLGQTLRRRLQEVEENQFEVIEATPAKGKNAA